VTQSYKLRSASAAIPVLLYHSVSDGSRGRPDSYTVSPTVFADHVEAIKASGRLAITIGQLAAVLRSTVSPPVPVVAVTFDDGYTDTTGAVALLADRGITSTVFITSDRLSLRGGLDPAALRAVAATGAEIGAHTATHPYLDELDPAGVRREIRDGRDIIQEQLGRPVESFAYPHGAYDASVRAAVIDAGFTAAAAVKNALSHIDDDPYAIARWTVRGHTTTSDLERVLNGSGARLAWSAERLRTRAYRGARRGRRVIRASRGKDARAPSDQLVLTDQLQAPVAVRTLDIDQPVDLALERDGDPYRTAMLVARRDGRPFASTVIGLTEGPNVPANALRMLFGEQQLAAQAPVAERPAPTVSAVLTTCARPGPLVEAVASILACEPGPLEVIVVENRPVGSELAAALEARFAGDERVRYVEESQVGLSAARNAGLGLVRGEVAAFTDDDVVVDRDWIGWIGQAFASEPDAACVTGLILPRDLNTPEQVRVEEFAGFAKGFERRVHRLAQPTSPLFPYAAGEFGSGACTALRTDVARQIGGFDPSLGAGTVARGGEDLDIYIRVLVTGHALVYEPAAIVWHRHREGRADLRRAVFGYGVSLTAMLTKHIVGGHSKAILRRVPAAARFLHDPTSRKNSRKRAGYPRRYDWIERAGMLVGPFAYLVSRRRQARADEGAPSELERSFAATWVSEIDLAGAPVDLRAPTRSGSDRFTRARLLVRRGVEPICFVNLPVEGGLVRLGDAFELVPTYGSLDPEAGAANVDALTLGRPPMGVVLCTRDRPESLRVAIKSILAASDAQTEIVVIDSAPTSDAAAKVIAELDDPRVRRVVEPAPGLSRARNRGLAEIDRELVAFTDDDVIVDAAWLAALARGFERSASVACVAGLVPAAELDTAAQAFFDAKVKWSAELRPRLFDLGAHRGAGLLFPFTAGDIGAGANFAVRRSALSGIGPFDEALGVGTPAQGGEDLDFFARTVLSGAAIAFEPAAIVWHYHRRGEAELRSQMYGYGSGLTAYAFKHLVTGRVAGHLLREVGSYDGRLRRPARTELSGTRSSGLPGLRRSELRGMLAGPALYLLGLLERRRRLGDEASTRPSAVRGRRHH
jgi:GT2 family glycosyltransferase/peptidoglycan/xylan/chitin deacetylase (PgdA/CDA1 family)